MNLAKIKRWFVVNKTIFTIFFIYLLVTLIVIFFHEIWEDEAQAWLTARDCSPIELIDRMKFEGHFLPWYIIIMPFAKLGLPFKTINVISWVISGISAWLILKYLPCRISKRAVFIFTLPMVCLYPVIARCYCLIPLATIFLVMSYKDRFRQPAKYLFSILLMANTHIYCFMFALFIGIEFLIDWFKRYKKLSRKQNRRLLICITVVVFLALLSYLPLIGSLENASVFEQHTGVELDIKHTLVGNPVSVMAIFSTLVPQPIIYVLVAMIIVPLFLYRRKMFVGLFISILWQFFLFDNVFTILLPQRAFIPTFFLMFFLFRRPQPSPWINNCSVGSLLFVAILVILTITSGNLFCEALAFISILFLILPRLFKNKDPSVFLPYYTKAFSSAILLLAIISLVEGFIYVKNEIEYPYSEALVTADFIRNELNINSDNAVFLTGTSDLITLTPLIAMQDDPNFRIFDINRETFFTYDPLDYKQKEPNKMNRIAEYCNIQKRPKCYYVTNYDITRESMTKMSDYSSSPIEQLLESGTLEPIFDSMAKNRDWNLTPTEHYRIYEIRH